MCRCVAVFEALDQIRSTSAGSNVQGRVERSNALPIEVQLLGFDRDDRSATLVDHDTVARSDPNRGLYPIKCNVWAVRPDRGAQFASVDRSLILRPDLAGFCHLPDKPIDGTSTPLGDVEDPAIVGYEACHLAHASRGARLRGLFQRSSARQVGREGLGLFGENLEEFLSLVVVHDDLDAVLLDQSFDELSPLDCLNVANVPAHRPDRPLDSNVTHLFSLVSRSRRTLRYESLR